MHAHPEQKQCKKEAKILRLLEVLRMYADFLRDLKTCGNVNLSHKGCGPLRLGVAFDQGQYRLLCGKFSYSENSPIYIYLLYRYYRHSVHFFVFNTLSATQYRLT